MNQNGSTFRIPSTVQKVFLKSSGIRFENLILYNWKWMGIKKNNSKV